MDHLVSEHIRIDITFRRDIILSRIERPVRCASRNASYDKCRHYDLHGTAPN